MPRIMYIQYTSPGAYPPLEYSSGQLAEAGWEVLFLGIAKHGDPRLAWHWRPGIRVRELAPAGQGWRTKLHYAWFGLWVLGWMVRWRPAYVYASDALACPVVLPLSYWPGLKIVYHEHDAPQLSGRGLMSRLVLRMRRQLAARAQARVLPNARRAERFVGEVACSQPTFTVWNCPGRAEIGPPRDPPRSDTLQVLYMGSVVPERLPRSIIQALALLPDGVNLRVIGYATPGHADYIRELRDLAAQSGIAQRTLFEDGMPHQELLLRSRDADVGLVLMPDDAHSQWMPGASNKPFEYLAGGLALLVANRPGWQRMFVDPGYGLSCQADDPRSVAAALQWLLEHPTARRAMGESGRQRVLAEWNYETQFGPVRQLLEQGATA